MSPLSKKDRLWLEEAFGPRTNFNPTERLLYSHDIAAMPGLFKPLAGDTVPDAVVQPESEEELVKLIRWASDKRIPLVPRGKGSSGYGGIIPAEKGIVVDFYRMRKVLAVDEKAETATVEPGITWEQLDVEVQKKGLTLRLYPTSYPSSSVGSWLAQGGAGIGSFEFGWFIDNVVGARVVLPAAYIATLAFREQDRDKVMPALREILKPCQGEILSDRIARYEWENRFKLMIVKRLGPSLVPAEVVVPLEKLGEVMEEIEQKVKQPVVKEGVIIRRGRGGRPEAVILGFIPSDQRKFSYNFVFGLVLSILKITKKHGGRPYATGYYFNGEAEKILGKERLKKIRAFKKISDPKNILNPGKVLSGKLLGRVVGLASPFEPLVRPFGNRVVTKLGEKFGKPVRGIPADVAWYAYGCSQCGYCLDECDQFYGRGWESQSPPRQVVLAAAVPGGQSGLGPVHGGYHSRLHDLRAVQPSLFGLPAH